MTLRITTPHGHLYRQIDVPVDAFSRTIAAASSCASLRTATAANVRTANAAQRGLGAALEVAHRAVVGSITSVLSSAATIVPEEPRQLCQPRLR